MAFGSQRKGVCTGWGKQWSGEVDARGLNLPKLGELWLDIASMPSVRIQDESNTSYHHNCSI